jgi:cell wall-associated NlpC family hydrolase
MRPFSIWLSAALAFALSFTVSAATTEKPKSKPASSAATPTPKTKSTANEPDSTPRPAAAQPGKKSEIGAASKPASSKSTDAANAEAKTPSAAAPAIPAKPKQNAADKPAAPAPACAPAATLDPGELREFATQPPRVQQLLGAALELTKLNLTYTYGSADPAKGGMDCSGTMYHLLRAQGFAEVPRDSSGQYAWVRKRGPFFAVVGKSASSFEFDDLLPGDLLFWTGTYETQREIPISHVMLYLGTEKKTKKRVMFGASDGRSYNGIQRWGVGVFDFKMPRENSANGSGSRVDFVGYGRIPALLAAADAVPPASATEPEEKPPKTAAASASTAKKKSESAAGTKPKGTRKISTPRTFE